jgi:hypothetical protein
MYRYLVELYLQTNKEKRDESQTTASIQAQSSGWLSNGGFMGNFFLLTSI